MTDRTDWAARIATLAAVGLPLYTLLEVNYPILSPQSQLAIFAGLGLLICFLTPPKTERQLATGADLKTRARWGRRLDLLFAAAIALVTLYQVVQTEPIFARFWLGGRFLGNRAGMETRWDIAIGAVGLVLVLEAARRTSGLALPLMSVGFLAYGMLGPYLPNFLLPHRGYDLERLVSHSFLQGQGVYGVALSVMFTYVFPFVIFGTLLEATGAIRFLIDASQRLLASSRGGPAKVAVVASGLMGTLSGSAVANTATIGTFTIPLMRSAGFPAHVAAGIEAAASSGGPLMPPVMGAGAYMMVELITPPVTYLRIAQAALIPAMLYYFSLFLAVHFQAGAVHATNPVTTRPAGTIWRMAWEGVVLAASIGSLLLFLILGYTAFRAVTVSLLVTTVVAALSPRTRVGPRRMLQALANSSRSGVSLIAASASVGIAIAVVVLTGAGSRLAGAILEYSHGSLFGALCLIMLVSLLLGTGLPSAVCYLLMATFIGPIVSELGIAPLAAHLFLFYFGMLSMVTPPVALTAFAASSIAGADFWESSVEALRFSIAGFTIPFLFVVRPQLLMLQDDGVTTASVLGIAGATILAALSIAPLAAAVGGFIWRPLGWGVRALLLGASVLVALPGAGSSRLSPANLAGVAIVIAITVREWRATADGRRGDRLEAAG